MAHHDDIAALPQSLYQRVTLQLLGICGDCQQERKEGKLPYHTAIVLPMWGELRNVKEKGSRRCFCKTCPGLDKQTCPLFCVLVDGLLGPHRERRDLDRKS